MAKKFDIEKASNGEQIPCPYCGKTGILAGKLQDGWIVTHKFGWVERAGKTDGVTFPCEVVLDGCGRDGKFGENFKPVEEEFVVEEPFSIEEEFTDESPWIFK